MSMWIRENRRSVGGEGRGRGGGGDGREEGERMKNTGAHSEPTTEKEEAMVVSRDGGWKE